MKCFSLLISAFILFNNLYFAQNSIGQYTSLFIETFKDTGKVKKEWNSSFEYRFVEEDNNIAVAIEGDGSNKFITTEVNLKEYEGDQIAIVAKYKGNNISELPNPWNGIKIMLRIDLEDGSTNWRALSAETGTFEWRNDTFLGYLPENILKTKLVLGLNNCKGEVIISDVKILLVKRKSSYPAPRESNYPIVKFHDLGTFRGAKVGTMITEDDIREFSEEWNGNVIQWQLGGSKYKNGLLSDSFQNDLQTELTRFDSLLNWCDKYNVKVILGLAYFGRNWKKTPLAQDILINTWRNISRRYKNRESLWAYDLVGEPKVTEVNLSNPEMLIWDDLIIKISEDIRNNDSETVIMIESGFGSPDYFSQLRPLDYSFDKIIYCFHFYAPHEFTHQTLYNYSTPYNYPSLINGIKWNKEKLREKMKSVIDFQNKYRVPIFVGEFSAIRWAPDSSAYKYLRDCIEIFEEMNWDWGYHAFREWHGWSVEHGNDKDDFTKASSTTDRELLLKQYYSLNKKDVAVPEKNNDNLPKFNLAPNYPNPFNPSTTIEFNLVENSEIELSLFDINGRKITELKKGVLAKGTHKVVWKGTNYEGKKVASGIYFYRLISCGTNITRHMILMK